MLKELISLLGLHRPIRAWAFALLVVASALSCALLFSPAQAAGGFVFLLGLICASCVDFDQMIIPDLFTIGLAVVGVGLSALVPALHLAGLSPLHPTVPSPLLIHLRSAAAALLGLAIGSSLALWLSLIGELLLDKEVLGFGDVKFLGAIGAFCGWQGAVFSVFGGAILGLLALVLADLWRRFGPASAAPLFRLESPSGEAGKVGWGAHFPFGPMLAVAAAAYFLALHPLADRYLALYRTLF